MLSRFFGVLCATLVVIGASTPGSANVVTRLGANRPILRTQQISPVPQGWPGNGYYRALYAFKGGTDGSGPNGMTGVNGVLYGTTQTGGTYGAGTVFGF